MVSWLSPRERAPHQAPVGCLPLLLPRRRPTGRVKVPARWARATVAV